ncbi:hypothetical protein ACRALDRAFT_2044259 [Sodiomyces alcalophilus JCM 7366]|uniref:uncharacterized protein n=1 Tax=Sodiomyces alcalophilus JCM 7366 TaxID=591952 RepID=UPI0039B4C5EE
MIRGARPLLRLRPGTQRLQHLSAQLSSTSSARNFVVQSHQRLSAILSSQVRLPGSVSAKAAYSKGPYEKIDREAEKELAKQKFKAAPDDVPSTSTTRSASATKIGGESQTMNKDLQHDINVVKDTLQMSDVPTAPYALGLAGTLPYLATSMGTVYLSWSLNTNWPSGHAILDSILMNHKDAQQWLALLEPIQLGYGALLISFLGAIHWGMEIVTKTTSPSRTKFRYGIGVLAPIVAWPTLLMPVEAALITQFVAFTALYGADTRATARGWAPPWYGRYRFILTAVVGAALFVSLVGRAKIGSAAPRLAEGFHESMDKKKAEPYSAKWAELNEQEKVKQRKAREEEEKRQKEEEEAEKKREQQQDAEKEEGSKKDGGDN